MVQKKGQYKSVNEKSVEAVELTQEFIRVAFEIMTKVFNCCKTYEMHKLLHQLHFINNLFKCFAEHCSGTPYPDNIIKNRKVYYPKLIDSYQNDCRALLHDIVAFGHRVEGYVSQCRIVCELHMYIRICKTVVCFLKNVKATNPAFFTTPPSYVRQNFKGKSGTFFKYLNSGI